MQNKYFMGLMSGTSVDAIDVVLVAFSNQKMQLIASHSHPLPQILKQKIHRLCQSTHASLSEIGETDVALGKQFANSCLALLKQTGLKAENICAIGSHGQTICHMPNLDTPFTWQIGDPNIIATLTNITTVADFRRRDLALGGQAAPLAPAFHQYLLDCEHEDRWVLNIGGMANITYLPQDKTKAVIGFDTGPGNTLMDAYCREHLQKDFDDNGEWAKSGTVNQELLSLLLSDPYFQQPPPKSTGREYFHLDWLNSKLTFIPTAVAPENIQATLLELTARTISDAIQDFQHAGSLWICGGGVHNITLQQRLQQLCTRTKIHTTEEIGIHPDWIEACAFAWLAKQTLEGKPGNIPSVTGARHASVLGAIYPVPK